MPAREQIFVIWLDFALHSHLVCLAAEANIMGDPHAADFVFGQSLPTYLVPLDVTTQCQLTGDELASMQGQGRFGTFLASITKFYLDYHRWGFNLR